MQNNPFFLLLRLCMVIVVLNVCHSGMGIAGGAKVAILPFEINAAEDIEYIHRGIREMITSRIGDGVQITVVEQNAVRDLLSTMRPGKLTKDVVRDIGGRLGSEYVISGSVTKIGTNLSIDMTLVSVSKEGVAWSVSAQSVGLDEVIPKVSILAQEIRSTISSGLETPETTTTGMQPLERGDTTGQGESASKEVMPGKVEEIDLSQDNDTVRETERSSGGDADEMKEEGEFLSEHLAEPEGSGEFLLKRKSTIDSRDENPAYQKSVNDLEKNSETTSPETSE